jgi:hypothetical protein
MGVFRVRPETLQLGLKFTVGGKNGKRFLSVAREEADTGGFFCGP